MSKDLRVKLKSIKNGIIDTMNDKYSMHDDLKELKMKIKAIRDENNKIINEAVDEKGKSLYTNAQKRDIALNIVLNGDKKYNRLIKKVESLEIDIRTNDIKMESFKYDFKIEEILSRILGD